MQSVIFGCIIRNASIEGLSIGGWFRIDKDSDTGLRRDTAYLLEDQSATEVNPDGWAFGVWDEAGTITLAWGQKKVKRRTCSLLVHAIEQAGSMFYRSNQK